MFIGNMIADAMLGIISGLYAPHYHALIKLIVICVAINIIALFTFQHKEFRRFRVFTLEPTIKTPIVWFFYRVISGFIIIGLFSLGTYLIKTKLTGS